MTPKALSHAPSRATLLRRRAELLEAQARIDRELADLEAHATLGDTFTSLDLPPGVSRRAFRERVASIPGARREGHVWHVPKASWFAARARGVGHRDIKPSNEVAKADAFIEAAGMRATRRSA